MEYLLNGTGPCRLVSYFSGMHRSATILLLFIVLACQPTEPTLPADWVAPGVSQSLAQMRKERVSEVSYDLTLHIPESVSEPILSRLILRFQLKDASQALPLDFAYGKEDQVAQYWRGEGEPFDLTFADEHLVIPAEALQEGENEFTFIFESGDGSLNRNPEYLYTLLVPDRARTVFPCFDQPNLKATYALSLVVPEGWEAMANGTLASKEPESLNEGRTRYTFAPSDRISTYLFSFVAGKFEAEERTRDGRTIRMLHRESDTEKVEANLETLFEEHFRALAWMEEYTGIPYPFQKFDFALIPSFQYGGMEHVGAIQYNNSSLMLDPSATLTQRMSRTRLIAHETAHMWFGDLVTMDWFDDVWMKEVFANFMAGKVARELYPEGDHNLNFLLSHHPAAYSVDRTEGANAIRQPLDNLNLAGTLYGAIIYNKAPIVLRQLEYQMGEEPFRRGLQRYLETYAFDNATWQDLLPLLEAETDVFAEGELARWSQAWVESAGRPELAFRKDHQLVQTDPLGQQRAWPMVFHQGFGADQQEVFMREATYGPVDSTTWLNTQGLGYGLFPVPEGEVPYPADALVRASVHITLFENMVAARGVTPDAVVDYWLKAIAREENTLVLERVLGYLGQVWWVYLSPGQRAARQATTERTLWNLIGQTQEQDRLQPLFQAYQSMGMTELALSRMYQVWAKELTIPGLKLSEGDFTSLAYELMVKEPERYEELLAGQAERITQDERRERFRYVAQAVHPRVAVRDSLFASWEDPTNRAKEPWVQSAAWWLHHPLQQSTSLKYLPQALLWLEDIQRTADIFFPKRWLDATFGQYATPEAWQVVESFLQEHPDYQPNLKAKILQATHTLRQAQIIQNPQ